MGHYLADLNPCSKCGQAYCLCTPDQVATAKPEPRSAEFVITDNYAVVTLAQMRKRSRATSVMGSMINATTLRSRTKYPTRASAKIAAVKQLDNAIAQAERHLASLRKRRASI